MPIAASSTAGDCRAAVATDAEVGGACRLIDPDGSGSLTAGDFTGIIDGHCARAGNSSGCSNIGPGLPGFRLQPDLLDQGQRENVGQCASAGACANIYDGFANTENNRCILPREESECPADRSAFVSGECVEITSAHDQRCFEENPERPIATNPFTGTVAESDCRAAGQDDADICATITFPGSDPTNSQNILGFGSVIDGYCAFDRTCSANSDERIYAVQPGLAVRDGNDIITSGVFVGECFNESMCRDSGGYPDQPANECRLATSHAECMGINSNTPRHDANVVNNCRAAATNADCAGVFSPDLPIRAADGSCRARNTGDCPGEILTAAGACEACPTGQSPNSAQTACECDRSTHINVAGTGEPLDCRVMCQSGQIRDPSDNNCRARTGQDCRGLNPPQILSGTSCQSCTAPLAPNDLGTSCICPTDTHETVGGSCLALCDPATEIRNSANECVTRVQLSSCEPHEELEDNACVECDENEFRGTGNSCTACDPNEVRAQGVAMCSCPLFDTGSACVPFIDPAMECESNQIVDEDTNTCQNCGAHEVRGADDMCDCQQFGEVGNCVPLVEVSTCAANEHIVDNECAECPVGQFRGDGNSSCTACPTNEVRAAEAASCSCPRQTHYKAGDGEPCVPHIVCEDNQARQADNTCAASCPPNEDLVNGVCECISSQIRVNGLGECVDRVACAGGTVSAANECMCPNTHEDIEGTCLQLCHENADRQDGTCQCNADYEGDGFACAACENGQTSEAGGSCACPMDQRLFAGGCAIPLECENQVLGPDNTCTDECTGGLLNIGGICEVMETCTDTYEYNAPTNRCVCPSGQRENTDQTACEAIPASGGGGGGGGGAAAAIIAVPVLLIGGYYLLGGFEYIDPIYNLSYQGENSDFTYQGDAGFSLNHGSLSSYARAIQSNGDAVSYESGISYGKDFYSLDYAAYESQSEYAYDLSANLNYGDGPWSISPTADAEFHYSADSEDWTADAGAGLTAAWTFHKWNIRAHSAFAGDLNHGLDVEFRF